VVAVLDTTAAIGPGDRLVLERASAALRRRAAGASRDLEGLFVVVNKIDSVVAAEVIRHLSQAHALLEGAGPSKDRGAEYFAVSASSGEGVDSLVEAVLGRLAPGPPYFPEEAVSDMPEAMWVAELVREQLLARVRDELPHSLACRVTEFEWPYVRVEVIVERDSQKAIVIGRGGELLKVVGSAVRAQLPPGAYLELRVRVEKHWQQRAASVDRLGY